MYYECYQLFRPPLRITVRPKKCFAYDLLMPWKPATLGVIPASLCLLSLPHLPGPPPPGQQAPLASFAPCLDCLLANPSTTSVDQRAKAYPHHAAVCLRRFIPRTFGANAAPFSSPISSTVRAGVPIICQTADRVLIEQGRREETREKREF